MDNIYIYYYINLLMIAGNIAALYDQLQNIYHCLNEKITWVKISWLWLAFYVLGKGWFYKYFWL